LGLAARSLVSKSLLRYRICDSGLVTWGIGLAAGLLGGAVWLVLRPPFPWRAVWPILGVVATVQAASWFVNRAIQEGDLSTVAPLLSVKIPMAAVLAFLVLGETYGPATYGAVGLAAAGAVLFGVGRPRPAQGGHGTPPVVAILLACAGAAAFAMADQFAQLGLNRSEGLGFLLWTLMLRGAFCGVMIARPAYRRYRVTGLDWLLFLVGGGVTVGALGSLYQAFRVSDSVTLTNVILGMRGLFGLFLGATLGRLLRVPLESQPARIYFLRAFGTGLLFLAILIALTS
jgi:hypothetical protein